jgi:autotransporter-associated beta strand protein
MNKSSGNALPGNVTVSGGFISSGGSDQIGNTSIVTLSGGTWNLSTFTETISQLMFTAGNFTQGIGGVLTVASGLDTAVTMTNSTTIAGNVVFANASGLTMGDGTTISGNLTFQGTGGVIYNGASTTATISGGVDLGGFGHSFTTGSGATPGMTCSGILSGVAGSDLTKMGPGELQLSGGSPNTYSGLTTVSAGTLLLNKTAGVSSIPGNVLVSGGNLLLNTANQIANTATMTVTAGSFNMAGNGEQIDNLVMNGGSVTQGGALFTLSPAGATALSMGGTASISGGSLSLPGPSQIVFNGSAGTGTVASDIDLNAASHTFDIATSTAGLSMDIQGVISNGTVTKTSAGTLRFSGSSPNTFTGLTTISGGTLLLQKTAVNAIVGDVLVNSGGNLALGASSQIVDTATITLSGGSMNMSGFTETITTFAFNSGALTQGGGLLALTNLTMGDSTLVAGPLAFTAAGGLTYTGASSTATISGSVDLGSFTQTFAIPNGSAAIDQTISGPIANGGLDKTGTGTLLLTGANTYGGGTTISAGTLQGNTTSLQGNISNSANLVFDQAGTGTYAGSITGAGTLTKQGGGAVNLTGANTTGLVTVSSGLLAVNGSLAGGGPMTVAPGATLGGTGVVTKNITFSGTLAPGNSIGTIHLVGAQEFTAGFNLDIEVDPAISDSVDIVGTLLIDPGASVTIDPAPGTYPNAITYTLVHTTGGVTGTFSNLTLTHPIFTGQLVYTNLDVLLEIGFRPFNELVTTGNAAQIARCLSGFTPDAGSDLAFIINELRASPSQAMLATTLNLMQPSQFTALAVMQENNTLYLNEGLFNHLESLTPYCQTAKLGLNLWSVPFTAHQIQKRHGLTQGYTATTPGVLLGLDGKIAKDLVVGLAAGYSHSDLKWTHHIGTAKEQAAYGAIYGRWAKKHGSIESSLVYGYSRYKTDRPIIFMVDIPVNRHAKGNHSSMQGSAHLKAAADWSCKKITFEPFAEAAYVYIREKGFKEKGAQSLDLDILSKNSNLLMSEAGLRIAYCKSCPRTILTPYVQASGIYESRRLGKHEKALFNGCPLNVTGLNPSRMMTGLEAGLNLTLGDQAAILSLAYKGRFAKRFMDNSGYLQLNVRF